MQGFKEFLESLQKMTDVRLNISIFIICLLLILVSPADRFILDPVPKLIPQSLILITSIRILFSIINLIHFFISKKMEIKTLKEQQDFECEKVKHENTLLKIQIEKELENLDVFQLYIIKNLIGKNHSSHQKGAALFSLTSKKITYVVATGESSQSVSLTDIARDILENQYNNNTTELEKNAATRAFNSMTGKELPLFKILLEKDSVKTTWLDRDRKIQYSPSHDTFKSYRKSIIFEYPQEGFNYSLNPILVEILKFY
ncbi:hypothetical protein JHW33_19425 [Rahnella aceris]|uniref:hypothetical protein n=1 Tax=Rahnella sp. (strain Y9602) TaxID=2703885 RepID=UPI0019064E00|nr:hypothetical protein [Rahnella aceris]QQN34556.1 hypothetical protein JHW33_19425 [Rahnella aceris]